MRLYLSATSKNHIGYTPDVLVIKTKRKTYEYDINGTVDFDYDGLDCRVKGDLEIRDSKTEEFREMNKAEEAKLLTLLSDLTKNKAIEINIYPAEDREEQEWVDLVENDELDEGSATLELNNGASIDFSFTPVFLGF